MNKEHLKTNTENKIRKKIKTSYQIIANRLMVLMVIMVGVMYLGGINDLSIKRFVLQENKRDLYTLKDENRSLETKIMALSSYSAINKKLANLKMIKVDKVDYITLNQAVAKR